MYGNKSAVRRNGGGGMEVGVSLGPQGMDLFRKCFADAMVWLHAGDDQSARAAGRCSQLT
ncbi:hypothetical protein EJB05_53745, partial [Eragrostis curvula]